MPVCQRANLAVPVIRYSWCHAFGFIRAKVDCVCAVGLSCALCVLVMQLQVCLQDDTYMIRPEKRVINKPVEIDRSKTPPLYNTSLGATAVECPHQLNPINTQTQIARAREQGRRSVKVLIQLSRSFVSNGAAL